MNAAGISSISKDKAAPFSRNPERLRLLDLHYYAGLRKAGFRNAESNCRA